MDREADQPFSRGVVFQDERIAGPHRVEKFGGRNLPPRNIDPAPVRNGAKRLIEEHGAGQHGKTRKMTRKGGVIRGDVKRAVHFHDSSIRNCWSTNPCSACSGSFPVALRGSRSTMSSGRGRNTGSSRCRNFSVNDASLKPGATTTAAKRATPVDPVIASLKKKAPSSTPGMALS